ncbi:DUF938 domain-containing protein [Thiohalomonas denitrificans]|uniref:DUF938 domain-containing protein n=1 Tax=Thiohalomonas denitrificans TaxID=415747 RepID=UPI003983367A
MPKPFAESCEQNKAPILDVLHREFTDPGRVLEIGSGTGQHAVWFARHLPHLVYCFILNGAFSESLAGQMQGALAQEWPAH